MSATILLVDDDPNILDTAVDILEDAGFIVKTAANAEQALGALHAHPIQLVICDFNLPDLTGEQLSRKIRETFPAMKIILMSGQQDLDTSALNAIVHKVLIKPVAPHEMLALIQQTLDK